MGMKVNDRLFRKKIKKLQRFIKNKLPTLALAEFKKNTPIDKGNARRKTKLTKKINGFKITGDYPYSGVIDRGEYPNPPKAGTGKTRGGYSTQAPKGIVDPTLDYIKDQMKRVTRKP